VSERGRYSSASKAIMIGLAIVDVLVAPVVAIVGGAALAAAASGRGGKQ
jgi:hypothetical protein